MVTIISSRETQFRYFDDVLEGPNWYDSKILDFGGTAAVDLSGCDDSVLRNDVVQVNVVMLTN